MQSALATSRYDETINPMQEPLTKPTRKNNTLEESGKALLTKSQSNHKREKRCSMMQQ